MSKAISRRRFVHCAVCAAAGTTLARPSRAFAFGQDPRGRREVMREFPYGAVQLTGGPIKQHFDRIHAHYLALDNDRLLKVFRERVALPAPGPDMGGWYDTNGFVPGLTLGQYTSGSDIAPVSDRHSCRRASRNGLWNSSGSRRVNLFVASTVLWKRRDVVFVPYFTVDTERYNTYFTIVR